MLQFLAYSFSLICLFRPVRAAVYLQEADDVRIHQLHKISELAQISVGALQEPTVWKRKVKTLANPGAIANVVEKKSHNVLFAYPVDRLGLPVLHVSIPNAIIVLNIISMEDFSR